MSYNRAITPEENQRNWAIRYLKDYVERNGNQIINADGVLRYARRGLYGDRYIWAKGLISSKPHEMENCNANPFDRRRPR